MKPPSKEALVKVARETITIVERGRYVAPSGKQVDISGAVQRSSRGTLVHAPGSVPEPRAVPGGGPPRMEVTAETTKAAARRLAGERVVALNFASARNVGGGFLKGSRTQEEDLCRASALYRTLSQASSSAYYAANRGVPSFLYTDFIIYTPDVPFFRGDRLELLEQTYSVSVITCPAPKADDCEEPEEEIDAAVRRRAGAILDVAAAAGDRTLILGAWGCGAFRNDPEKVSRAFVEHLTSSRYAGLFDLAVFAVYDLPDRPANLPIFRSVVERT